MRWLLLPHSLSRVDAPRPRHDGQRGSAPARPTQIHQWFLEHKEKVDDVATKSRALHCPLLAKLVCPRTRPQPRLALALAAGVVGLVVDARRPQIKMLGAEKAIARARMLLELHGKLAMPVVGAPRRALLARDAPGGGGPAPSDVFKPPPGLNQ